MCEGVDVFGGLRAGGQGGKGGALEGARLACLCALETGRGRRCCKCGTTMILIGAVSVVRPMHVRMFELLT